MNHQKQIEDELRKENDFAETLINIAQFIIVVINKEGKILRFNPQIEKLSGYSFAEVRERDWFTMFFRATERDLMQKAVLDSKSSFSCHHIPMLLKDGTLREIEWYNTRLRSGNGRYQYIIIGLDITEKTRTARELSQVNGRMEMLLRNASRLNSRLDLDGLLKLLCEDISAMMQTKVSATFFEKKPKGLYLIFSYGLPSRQRNFGPIPPDVYDRLLKNNQLRLTATELRAWDILPDIARDEPDLCAIALITLFKTERLLGTLNLYHYQGSREYSESDFNLLRGFADQASLAITNALLYEQVKTSQKQLRRLNAQIIASQEEERKRLSRELHDEAGQSLTALKICLVLLKNDIPAECSLLKEKLADAIMMVDTTLESLRALAHQLRPPFMKDNSINLILEDFCRNFSKQSGLEISYLGTDLFNIQEEVCLCLYRILQESLTNIVKHAQASSVRVQLSQDDQQIKLMVKDDGIGVNKERILSRRKIKGIGLLGMAERLEILGGRLELKSETGKGTRLIALIPWKNTRDRCHYC